MKLALIGPGIMPIPPTGWGAVESLIWDYALELDELGHEGTIVNTPDWDEIIKYLNEDSYEFAHLHYDVFHPIMDRIANETNSRIMMAGIDFSNKTVELGDFFSPTGDVEKDLEFIKEYFANFAGKRPELS